MDSLKRQEGGNHYKGLKIQPVEYIHGNNIPFIEGCIIKYVSRHREKNKLEDLKKAKHFLDILIDLEYKQENAMSEFAKVNDQYFTAPQSEFGIRAMNKIIYEGKPKKIKK